MTPERQSKTTSAATRFSDGQTTLLMLLPAMLLFILGAVSSIDVPGLYMDAVNPDYLVVRLLGQSASISSGVIPGALVLGLFPILIQLYHGALPYWLGLPSYALLGTGVVGIRITNMLFGLLVLVAVALFLKAFRVRSMLAGLILAALALDPGFLFTFRTQFYINVLPLAPLLASIAWVEHRRPTLPLAVGTGILAGMAVYGYFIYAFLVPVAGIYAALRWRGSPSWPRLVAAWSVGVAIGVLPYPLGLLLALVATGGLDGFMDFLKIDLGVLSVGQSGLSFAGRLAYLSDMVLWTVKDVGPASMMLHRQLPLSFPLLKQVTLLGLPALGVTWAVFRPRLRPGLLIVAGFMMGAAILFLVFGNRLWLQHAAMLLPILYIALAFTLGALGHGRVALLATGLAVAPLIAGNIVDRRTVLFELERTGGVGLASDAVERFTEDALRNRTPTHAFFPDWGISMPFIMVSSGSIPLTADFTATAARAVLCSGQDALLAVMDDQDTSRLAPWIDAVGWGSPQRTSYSQRDGVPVLTALRWDASAKPTKPCT